MKAPDKIYLQVCGDCELNNCDNCFFKELEDNITWSKDRIFLRDIEYICTDAFVEKAWDWIEDNILSSNQQDKTLLYYEQFKKYLED